MSLDPTVRAGWCAFTRRFEGDVAWPYLDVKGLATVGLGCLVEPASIFVALPWLDSDGELAAPGVVSWAWSALKVQRRGLPAGQYRGMTGLHLSDEQIDSLALARLDADVVALELRFGDLSRLPAPAQQVLCSMSWAMGAGFPARFPRFCAALAAGDWATAADECRIDETGNPGVAPRNAANRALLLSLT